jgi:hypothetical protein
MTAGLIANHCRHQGSHCGALDSVFSETFADAAWAVHRKSLPSGLIAGAHLDSVSIETFMTPLGCVTNHCADVQESHGAHGSRGRAVTVRCDSLDVVFLPAS